jgi:hypothetical protein
MSHTTVNSALRGTKIPSWPVVAKLVAYFDGDVEQFRTLWVEAREPEQATSSFQRSEVSVFVSYARIDDEATYGRVSRLVDDIANTYRSITGKAVGTFKDVDSIAPGDDWKDRIRLGLSSSSIFLAFISPAYLRSPNCREELNEFFAFLDANSSVRLIIPLLYADPDRIEMSFPDDNLWKRVSKLNWVNIAKLRSIDPGSSEWIERTEGIAERIDQVLTEFAQFDDTERERSDSPDSGTGPYEDMFGQMASLEQAMPDMARDMDRFAVLMQQLGETVEESAPRMEKADTFSKKIVASKAIAKQLDPIANEMATLAEDIVEYFSRWNEPIRFMLESARKTDDLNNPEIVGSLRSIWQLASQGSESLLSVDILKQAVSGGMGFSRDLDRPFKNVQRACLELADLRGLLNGWLEELRLLQDDHPGIFSAVGD